ncbi:MAG: hypothetical protein EOS23_26430 [Mesorhizobium sp.]|nr:MAG: hypothetical protein EOS23_26430 [Mesorhizobium sp.]
MPNTSVRATAEGLPDSPRNPHRFACLRQRLTAWNSGAGSNPTTQKSVSVEDSFMNRHVSRRTLMTTGLAAGAAFAAVATDDRAIAKSIETIPKAFASIDDRLDRLPADVAERLRTAFHKILDEVDAMIERGESDAAIAAHIDNFGRVLRG